MKRLMSCVMMMTGVLFAEESAKPVTIASAEVAEVNKAVTTHVVVSAKSSVDKDIDAYCKEAGITLGFVKGKDAFYLKGVERVRANVTSPNFVKSRSLAYAKAYQNAVAEYVLLKYGMTSSEQVNEIFSDESSNRLEPTADVKGTLERLAEKTAQLTEAKLDENLRKMGVQPKGSVSEKRTLMKNAVMRQSMKRALGASAGLLPVQTFEGWNENGQYAVGVIVRGGAATETIAACLRQKVRPALSRPEAGLSVEDALPNEKELVSQFGVRMFFGKDGTPALMSVGQWGSSYTGKDADKAEDALDRARDQAVNEADDQLTMFINSSLSLSELSERSEDTGEEVSFDENQVPTQSDILTYIDRLSKKSRMTGRDTMIGRMTVAGFPKVIEHPNGHKLAVCVRVWSFDQYDAMTRAKVLPKVNPGPTVKPGPEGRNRGRAYDF